MRVSLDNIQQGAWVDLLDYIPWSVMKKAMYMWQKVDAETKKDHTTEADHEAVHDAIVKEMVSSWNFKRPDGVLYDRAPAHLSEQDFKRIDGRVGAVVYLYTMNLLNKKPEGAAADPN